jgi:uncharacterized protein involved in outer membrane biogenesis
MLKKILSIGLLLIVVIAVGVITFASHVVKNAVNRIGPAVLGVPVAVEHVRAYPVRGDIHIRGLIIGNPEGFKTDQLFSMGELNVDLSVKSILTDTIIIRKIEVVAPEISYEMTLRGSNIGALQESLAGEKSETNETETAEEKPVEAAPGKKLIIENFIISDGKVKLSLPGMMGTAVPLPLPGIHLTDIGKEEQGASVTDVVGKIFGAVFSAVTQVVTSSGKLVGDGAKLIGDGAMAVGGVAVDGVSAVGGAAVDGVSAVGKGVAGAVGGVINVLGGSKEEKAAE